MAVPHVWDAERAPRTRERFSDFCDGGSTAGRGDPRSALEEPGSKRGHRTAQQAGRWALGAGCATLWLALLVTSNFSAVAVALGLLWMLLILN